jgi:hypothetical protein
MISPDLYGANLSRANLVGANLSGVNLSAADLSGADLSEANLSEADLSAADLSGANLSEAELLKADLSGARLLGADLREAKPVMADFSMADLSGADLSEANLSSADFSMAELSGADFSQAILRDAALGATNLSEVKGLESVIHWGPSSIGIDTFFLSGGKIPEAFLRGAGVPDIFIQYAASLAGVPFEFYSCFISFSSKDEALAQRLHADLQSKGVRCWFAPDSLKIGDKFRVQIDKAVRIYDKLLLLLSKHSVKSDWVEKEVETAFEKERKQKHTVLFPVRLDEAVMEIASGWPADIRRTRNIGDFTKWKDHAAYQKAFDRLLRDLKSEKGPPANSGEALTP